MKTNLGSLTHRLQANCARTSQKTAICKVQGLSANDGDKKKIRRRSPDVRLAEFKFARRHKRQFSQFLRSIIKCFHPNKKDFHEKLFLFLKNGAVLYFGLIIVQNVGCVCWFHDRYHSRRYSKGAELVYTRTSCLIHVYIIIGQIVPEQNYSSLRGALEMYCEDKSDLGYYVFMCSQFKYQ